MNRPVICARLRAALACLMLQSFCVNTLFAEAPPTHDPTVGTMEGQPGTQGGASTYEVPIIVPPGRDGMQPSLSLVYNSRTGDGVMGMGWSMSGTSSIHRCPQTPEQDSTTQSTFSPAVSYTNNDRLCLDGQRLVKVNTGAYGATGSEYRTEVDSFARIYQTGGDLTGAATCFRVEQKDGRVLYYGAVTNGTPQNGGAPTSCLTSSANARVQPTGAAATLAWQVERIEDRVGNNELFAYTNYGNGEVLLHTVTYTGYTPSGTVGDRVVTLTYQSRTIAVSNVSDYASSYLAGGLTTQTQALKCITTQVGTVNAPNPCDQTKFVRTYLPTYAAAGHSAETFGYAGRLLMTNLQACASSSGAASCHPATHFLYNDGVLDYPFKALTGLGLPGSTTSINPYQLTTIANLDGDGTRESAASVDGHKYLVQLTGDRQLHSALDLTGTTFCVISSCYADVDASGRSAQILTPASTGVAQIISFSAWNYALFGRGQVATGNPFFTVASNIVYQYSATGQGSREVRAADFNGDGKVDIAVVGPDATTCGTDTFGAKRGVFVWLNTMTTPLTSGTTATFTPSKGTVAAPLAEVCLPRTVSGTAYDEATVEHVADFDGNGLPDIYLVYSGGGTNTGNFAGVARFQHSGTGISASISSCTGIGLVDSGSASTDECNWKQNYVTHWMDVNGDGLEDFVIARPTQGQWQLRLNKGGGTLGPVIIPTGSNTAGLVTYTLQGVTYPTLFRYAGRLPTMDVDSDGKPDLLVPSTTQGLDGFALKMCTITKVEPYSNGEGCPIAAGQSVSPNNLEAATCAAYACPENPDGNSVNLPANSGQPGYAFQWNNLPAFGAYQGAAVHGAPSDNSSYHLAMLKFVQTSSSTFRLDLVETPVVSRLTDSLAHTDDLFGDGLSDMLSSVGCANYIISNGSPGDNGYWSYPACSVVGDGTYGPSTLPDGTATSGFGTTVVLYASINQGVAALGGSPSDLVNRPAHLPLPTIPNAPATPLLPLPILPSLLDGAFNGVGDFASWGYLPLSAPSTTDGKPLYTIPASSGYNDSRHFYFQSSMPVVFGMAQSNGNGNGADASDIYGFRSFHYRYSQAIYNHFGRGFQGFRTIATQTLATDANQQIETTTTYRQKFPLTGKVDSVTQVAPDIAHTISLESDTWICGPPSRTACPEGDSLPIPTGLAAYITVLDRKLTQNYDLSAGTALSHIDIVNAATTTGGTSGWDQYGNLGKQVVTKADDTSGTSKFVDSQITTTTRTFTQNTGVWWLDHLDDQTVASSIAYNTNHTLPAGASAPTRNVHTTFTWNTDRTPATQIVQVGVTGQEKTTSYTYPSTSYGLPSAITISAPSATPSSRATNFTYTKDGTTASADGYFVLTTSNPLIQVTTTKRSTRDGQITGLTNPNNLQTNNTYDVFGRPTQVDFLDSLGAQLVPSQRMALVRCSDVAISDCPVSGSDAFGEDNNQAYVAYRSVATQDGFPTKVAWYDSLGRTVKEAERGFNNTFNATVTTYDEMNRVEAKTVPFAVGSAIPSDGLTTWDYDRLNRPLSKLAPGGALDPTHGDVLTTYTYTTTRTDIKVQAENVTTCTAASNLCMLMKRYTDVLGDLVKATQSPDGSTDYVVKYWYDALHNAVAAQDAESNVLKASYNDLSQRQQVVDPDAGTATFSYDALDEVLSETDARSVATANVYDALGRLTQRTATSNPTPVPAVIRDVWVYDPSGAAGLLNYTQRSTGATVGGLAQIWKETNGYDAATKRLTSQTTQLDGQAGSWLTGYGYDASGRLNALSYPSGLKIGRGYTTYGYLNQITNIATSAVYWTGTSADPWGSIQQESYGGSITGSHQFDPNTGQVINRHWSTSSGAVDDWTYSYDSFANVKNQARTAPGTSATETFGYDPLQRLTSAQACPGGVCSTTTFGYTASGNITYKSDYSNATAGAYTYGGSGCGPHGVRQVVKGATTITYTCDLSGNVIGGNTLSATYDFQNLPWTISRTGAGVAQFSYDSQGQRFKELATSRSTWYGRQGFERTTIGSTTTDRHELGPVVVTQAGATTTVFAELKDRLGSTVEIKDTNTSGVLVPMLRSYDAWGEARNRDFSQRTNGTLNLDPQTLRGFTGHEHVDDVWLTHMNGRVYDYQLGRFLSVDPVIQNPASSQSLNPYSYLGNNPLSGTDPTGYDCQADNKGEVESSCLMSNNGINKITDANGKAMATVIVANKGDNITVTGNGGSISATFTGKAGDVSRVLNGGPPSDIGGISKATNGTLDGTAASYAFGQSKPPSQPIDMMAAAQQTQQRADALALQQWTFAHEGLEGVPILGVEAIGQAAYGAYNEIKQDGGVSAATIGGIAVTAAAGMLHVPGSGAAGKEAGAIASDLAAEAQTLRQASQSLGANPFRGKSADEIADMLSQKGYVPKGRDPVAGRGTYVNPETGRGYHIDANHPDPKGPHVGVHRPRDMRDTLKPRDYPIGGQ